MCSKALPHDSAGDYDHWFSKGMVLTAGGAGIHARYARTSANSESDITFAEYGADLRGRLRPCCCTHGHQGARENQNAYHTPSHRASSKVGLLFLLVGGP